MNCPKCNGVGHFKGYQRQSLSHYTVKCSWCYGTGSGVPLAKYAGIGSRETPENVCLQMGNVAMQLAMRGFVLRSGAAIGADKGFEKGCDVMKGRKVIRVATQHPPALEHAARFHPNWDACSEHAKQLHARNSQLMLGDWYDDPVAFVVCWTDGGGIKGGTGQALRIADAMGIPVFNMWFDDAIPRLWSWLDG